MKNAIIRQWVIGEVSWRRMGRSLGLILVLVYGIGLFYGIFFADALIFQPKPATYSHGDPFIQLTMADEERLTIRYLSYPGAQYTILYSHGNAEDLGELEKVFERFHSHGFSIVAYDYSGYGTSTGTPSESTTYANILSVYEYLRDQQHLQPDQILVFGRSVGGGPSVELAAHYPVGGLILESVFTSAFRVITRIPIFPFDKFDNFGKIGSVSCPLLVIHGQEDEVIPFWHGKAVYQRAMEPKMSFWVPSAHHNDVMGVAGDAYWKTIDEFMRLVRASGLANMRNSTEEEKGPLGNEFRLISWCCCWKYQITTECIRWTSILVGEKATIQGRQEYGGP